MFGWGLKELKFETNLQSAERTLKPVVDSGDFHSTDYKAKKAIFIEAFFNEHSQLQHYSCCCVTRVYINIPSSTTV